MKKIRILLVDDDSRIRATLSEYLRESGFEVITAANCAEALRLNNGNIEATLLDLMLPDGSGLDLLREFRERFPKQAIVMISGAASLADAVTAVKAGAIDFLEKPLGPEKVEITILNALQLARLNRRFDSEQSANADRYQLVGESAAMKRVRDQIDAVARTDTTVLLLGESGTGKEVAANMIHLKSGRRDEALVAVNTAAIPHELLESEMFGHEKGSFTGATQRRIGRFEQADRGTLFLDEIGEMPQHLQAKLLRVLEEFKVERVGGNQTLDVDFRLICATNRSLHDEVKQGKFRQDLLFRINVFAIELPALRTIPEDIEFIATHHLNRLCQKMGKSGVKLSRELVGWFKSYRFPGNVRELRNILEHLLILHRDGELVIDDARALELASTNPEPGTLKDAVAKFEAEYIAKVLKESRGNITQAAETLGLDRSYLYRKMKSLGIAGEE